MHIDWQHPVNWNDSLNDGLVSWWLNVPHWQGGATWRDLVGQNDGTLILMDPTDWLTESHPGGFGSLDFEGFNDYVDCGNDASLNLTAAFTTIQWIHPTSTFNETFSQKGHYNGGSDNSGWTARVSGLLVKFFLEDNNEVLVSSSASSIAADIWQHIALSFDGTTAKIYIDSSEDGSGSAGVGSHADHPYEIGRKQHGGGGDHFNGRIDDVRIYNRALPESEIAEVYQDSQVEYRRTLRRLRRGAFVAPAAVDISHVAALADSFDNVVQRRPIKVTNF